MSIIQGNDSSNSVVLEKDKVSKNASYNIASVAKANNLGTMSIEKLILEGIIYTNHVNCA